MSGDDATLTATGQYGMGGDDDAILKNADLVGGTVHFAARQSR